MSRISGEFTCGGHGSHRFQNVAKRLDKRTAATNDDTPTIRCNDGLYGASLIVRTQSAELLRRMEDSQNVDLFIVPIHHVNDSIVAIEDLADRLVADLRHDAPHPWKPLKGANLLDHLLLKHFREVVRTDTLVILDDCIEFALSLLGKMDACHGICYWFSFERRRFKRASISSSGTVFPSSAYFRPTSILCRKRRHSIASSIVASSGSSSTARTIFAFVVACDIGGFTQVGSASQNVRPRAVASSQAAFPPHNDVAQVQGALPLLIETVLLNESAR